MAEEANHHPDILLHGWNKVKLSLTNHSAGGLTEMDFAMAGRFDDLQARAVRARPTSRRSGTSRRSEAESAVTRGLLLPFAASLNERRRRILEVVTRGSGASARPELAACAGRPMTALLIILTGRWCSSTPSS